MRSTRSPISAVEEDAALGADVVAEDDLIRAEPQREEQLSPQRAERHAALAGVSRRLVVVAARVVELRRARADDDVVVGELAEVDARLVDLQIRESSPAADRGRTAPAALRS